MGASRWTCQAALAAALLSVAAPAGASVQVDPIARLSLESGYDSNVLYNGVGGPMGRVSPDLGVQMQDRTWKLDALAGGDLLMYPQNGSAAAWNQRGKLLFHARPTERLDVDTTFDATYALDPIGLARLGIFGVAGAGLVMHARAGVGYRLDRLWKLTPFFEEYLVRFDTTASGSAAHTPGFELSRLVGHRLELGTVYKYDYFQGIGAGVPNAQAHEALALLRYRMSRRLTLELQAGPAFWLPPVGGGSSAVVPEASVQLVSAWRGGGFRVTVRHGVGLGLTATPGLFDAAETGITTRIGRHFELHADGGLWRSGSIPWGGPNPQLLYGIEGSIDYRVQKGLLLGIGGARFARVDINDPLFQRNVLGLHVTWELAQPRGGP